MGCAATELDAALARQRAAFLRDGPPGLAARRADLKALGGAVRARRWPASQRLGDRPTIWVLASISRNRPIHPLRMRHDLDGRKVHFAGAEHRQRVGLDDLARNGNLRQAVQVAIGNERLH